LNVGFVNQPVEEAFNGQPQPTHQPIVVFLGVAQLFTFRLLFRSIAGCLSLREPCLQSWIKKGFVANERTVCGK